MTTSPSGVVSIPMEINGKKAQMLVDTGGFLTHVTWEFTRDLDLDLRRSFIGMAAVNMVINQTAKIDSLKIGDMSTNNPSPIYVASQSSYPPDLDGNLGPDYMRNYDIEFDFVAGKMNYFSPARCPDHVVYWPHDTYAEVPIATDFEGHIVVPAMLDGKPIKLVLDTGAEYSIMTLEAVSALFGWDEKSPPYKKFADHSINGGAMTPIYFYPFKELNFQDISIRTPRIFMIPRNRMPSVGGAIPEMVLGMSILRQLHIYIGYRAGKLFLTTAEKSQGTQTSPSTGPEAP